MVQGRKQRPVRRVLALVLALAMVLTGTYTDGLQVKAAGDGNASTTKVLNISDLAEANTDKSKTENWQITGGTDNAFTLYCYGKASGGSQIKSDSQTFSDNQLFTKVFSTGGTAKTSQCNIGFKAGANAQVKVWWVCAGPDRTSKPNDPYRELKIFDDGSWSETTSLNPTKDTQYITTFKVPAAGNYFVGSSSSSVNIYKIEVTETGTTGGEGGGTDTPDEPSGSFDGVDIDPAKGNVFDFGAEKLNDPKYNDVLSVDAINSWYPGVEPGTSGKTIASFQLKDKEGNLVMEFDDGGNPATHRLRTTNTALTRKDDKSLTDAADGTTVYPGYIYSNASSTDKVYLGFKLKAGDIVTAYVSANSACTCQYVFENMGDASDKQTSDVNVEASSKAYKTTFYATKDAEYKIYNSSEKMVVARVIVDHTKEVDAAGSVTVSSGKLSDGATVNFTCNETGEVVKGAISGNAYSAKLRTGYSYKLSLGGADKFIISSDTDLAVPLDAAEAKKDVTIDPVSLVKVSGTITVDGGANAQVLGNIKKFVLTSQDEGTVFVPALTFDATTGTYSVELENGVSYTLSVQGINDYEIKDNTWKFTAETADKVLAITKKPVYPVTIEPEGATLDNLAGAKVTFTNLGAEGLGIAGDEGYTYEFTIGTDTIELRDGVYDVKVTESGSYRQKLTSNLKVEGKAVTKKIGFTADPVTQWNFSASDFNDGSYATQGDHTYKTLHFTDGLAHNSKYLFVKPGCVIEVPVQGDSKITVTPEYSNGAEVFFDVNGNGTYDEGTDEKYSITDQGATPHTFTYTGLEGVVKLVSPTGGLYLLSIKVVENAEYKATVTVGKDKDYPTINDALAAIRKMERTDGQRVTVLIDPGNYEEMLVVDVKDVTLKNASATPSIALTDKGVGIDENAVRITSYYGHGYDYYSMTEDCQYDEEVLAVNKENGYASFDNPGSGTTKNSYWNATVRISKNKEGADGSGFRAEGIIFENSFNQYVSAKAADDVIVAKTGSKEGSVPRAEMEAGDTTVQDKAYVERAAALAIESDCTEVYFENCKFVGRQDTLYGGTGVTAAFYDCAVYGGTDYIFGGMNAVFAKCDLVFNTSENKNDVGYITAPQQKTGRGYLMYNCTVTSTVPGVDTASRYGSKAGYFGRPWGADTTEAVFYATIVEPTCEKYFRKSPSLIEPAGWMNTLSGSSKLCAEYNTFEMAVDVSKLTETDTTGAKVAVDNSGNRASWSGGVLTDGKLADGKDISVETFLGTTWKPFEGKNMTIEGADKVGTVNNTPNVDSLVLEAAETVKKFEAGTEVPAGTVFDPSFRIIGKVTQKYSASTNSLEVAGVGTTGAVPAGAIEFTTAAETEVILTVSSTGKTNYSAIQLVDADGKVIKGSGYYSVPAADVDVKIGAGIKDYAVYGNETAQTELTFSEVPAGTYRIMAPPVPKTEGLIDRGFRVISIVVEGAKGTVEPTRGAWADVAAPSIEKVAKNTEDPTKVDVTVTANVDFLTGADYVQVDMLNAQNEVVDSKRVASANADGKLIFSFVPAATGEYTFKATAARGSETGGKASAASDPIDFKLPLGEASVSEVTNAGKGSDGLGQVKVVWSPVPEAVKYVITATEKAAGTETPAVKSLETEGTVDGENLTAVIGGLAIGKTYVISVAAKRGEETGPSGLTKDITVEASADMRKVYELKANDLADVAENTKADGDTDQAGTDNYFTIIYSKGTKVDANAKEWKDAGYEYKGTKRINFKGAVSKDKDAIKFTTENPASVRIWWVLGAADRQMAILDENGNTVASTEGTFATSTPLLSVLTVDKAGTYYLGGTPGKNYIFKVQVTETPGGVPAEPEIPLMAWDKVEAPEIISAAVNATDAGKIDVVVKGLVGAVGPEGTQAAEKLVVDMIDAKGDIVATMESKAKSEEIQVKDEAAGSTDATDKPMTKIMGTSLSFEPYTSGKYTFVARLMREKEESKESAESKEVDFKLPLKTPTIKGVVNKGNGSIEVSWFKVTEARNYIVTVYKVTPATGDTEASEQELKSVTTASLKTVITGLTEGDNVKVTVVAARKDEKSGEAVQYTTITKDAEKKWLFSAFGQGVDTKNNGYIENPDGSVTVYSESGKGKIVPASNDGLAFYYNTIDPKTENFTLTADVHIDKRTVNNGQEGFGLMVADAVGENGNNSNFWNNSYQLVASKIEYFWDASANNGQGAVTTSNEYDKYSMKLGLGWTAKEGNTATDVARIAAGEIAMAPNFSTTSGTLETYMPKLGKPAGEYDIIGNSYKDNELVTGDLKITDFKLQIQRNNTGYVLRYLDKDGSVINEKLFYDDDRNKLTQIDKQNIYVGFFASRHTRITVSNIELTTIDPDEDAPAQERPITTVAHNYQVVSSHYSNSEDYDLIFKGNADGKLTILDDDGNAVAQDMDVTANKKCIIKTQLKTGKNKFTVAFVPNADYKPSQYEVLDSYEKYVFGHDVTYGEIIGVQGAEGKIIYVSPEGKADGLGTKESPVDIHSAVAYADAGNRIYLAGGTYLSDNVLIDRGHNGTADKPIYLMADPEAKTRPVFDFTNQTLSTSAMILAGDYWYLKGFDVTKSKNAQKGLQVSGHYNVVEDVDTYRNGNTGIQISRYLDASRDEWPSYNTILNCTSYLNADIGYEDADGFAAKLTVGDGNRFVGCIAAYNADDGWDLFAKVQDGSIGIVTIENCLAFKNGYVMDEQYNEVNAGNGNGFKMGGDSMSGYHVLKNSIAFGNKAKGIDSNSCPDIQVSNSISFDNEAANVALYTNSAVNTDYGVTGVLSWKSNTGEGENIKPKGTQGSTSVKIYNATNFFFNGSKSVNTEGVEVAADWFKSIDMAKAITDRENGIKREADGTINMNGFLEVTDKVPAGVGARLSNTAADVVLEKVEVVNVYAGSVSKLGDVKLSDKLTAAGYNWKYPETATDVFAGTEAEFVISAEGKEDKVAIVNFIDITGVEAVAESGDPGLLIGDGTLVLKAVPVTAPAVALENVQGLPEITYDFTSGDKLGLSISKNADKATITRGSSAKDGIAKVNITLKTTAKGKSLIKRGVYTFTARAIAFSFSYTVEGATEDKGVITVDPNTTFSLKDLKAVGLASEGVKVSVNDARVLKMSGTSFTALAEGTATITLTSQADKTAVKTIIVVVRGLEFKTNVSTLTIDKAKVAGAQLTALGCYGGTIDANSVVIKSVASGNKDVTKYFAINNVVGNVYSISTVEFGTAESPERVPNGTYKLILTGKTGGTDKDFEEVTVKVMETKPSVSIKQGRKVNLFYTAGSAAGNGALTVSSKQAKVTLAQTDVANADYRINSTKTGYTISLKNKADGKNKKITATVSFNGYKPSYDKKVNINVGTINKAPKLVLEVDNKILYTKLGITDTHVRILNKDDNTYVTSAEVKLADSKPAFERANKDFALSQDGTEYLLVADKTGTAKISVQDFDWTKEVVLSQKITVNNSVPKATFKKVTLNTDSRYVGKEQAASVVTVKNALDYKVRNLTLKGTNAKANTLLEYLDYSVAVDDEGRNVLLVSFKADKPLPVKNGKCEFKGSYSFKATFGLNKLKATEIKPSTVKISVVPTATVTTRQSGSIDLVNRVGSSVTMKPTLKNLNGKVVGVALDDDASNQFDVVWDSAKQAAVVTAKEGIELKKGGRYKVTPRFSVETNGGDVWVNAKTVIITPKQSKLKTTKVNVLETRLSAPGAGARAAFKATSPAKAELLDMIQMNYTENFQLYYDDQSDTVTVKIINKAGLKAGMTYKIKAGLVVEDSGVNMKQQVVTFSVKVIR